MGSIQAHLWHLSVGPLLTLRPYLSYTSLLGLEGFCVHC
jgi:hypothetical protein